MSMGPLCLFWWIFVEHLNPILYIPNTFFASKLMLSNKRSKSIANGWRSTVLEVDRGDPDTANLAGTREVFHPPFLNSWLPKQWRKLVWNRISCVFAWNLIHPWFLLGDHVLLLLVPGQLLSPESWRLAQRPAANKRLSIGGAMKNVQCCQPDKKNRLPVALPVPLPPREEAGTNARKKKRERYHADTVRFFWGGGVVVVKVFWAGQKPWVDLIADLKALVTKNHSYSWLTFQDFFLFSNIFPDAPCMEYLPTFTINLSQMKVNIPVPWGIWVLVCKILSGISGSVWYFMNQS